MCIRFLLIFAIRSDVVSIKPVINEEKGRYRNPFRKKNKSPPCCNVKYCRSIFSRRDAKRLSNTVKVPFLCARIRGQNNASGWRQLNVPISRIFYSRISTMPFSRLPATAPSSLFCPYFYFHAAVHTAFAKCTYS